MRLPAIELASLATEIEHRLKNATFNDVVSLLRSKTEVEFDGWDRECWRLPGALELLSFHYGNTRTALGFLRSDATQAEWKSHLDRLPEPLRPVAQCLDVTLLTQEERHALRAAFDAAEADGWGRIRSNLFALSPEELPFLFEDYESPGIDVLVQEGDGERSWSTLSEFTDTRADGAEPPSVLEDRSGPSRRAAARQEGVRVVVDDAASAVTRGFSFAISLVCFSLCAVIPVIAYPVLLPGMLRSGDWTATLFTTGLLAGMGLLPLALVWRKLGHRWHLAVFGLHVLGLCVGAGRFLFT